MEVRHARVESKGLNKMSVTYEVWDTETANRIGAFPTESEAIALLGDVLRVNGHDVAREMVVLAYPDDGSDPITVLEGADFVARAVTRSDVPVGG
jgi:hypothetical protein